MIYVFIYLFLFENLIFSILEWSLMKELSFKSINIQTFTLSSRRLLVRSSYYKEGNISYRFVGSYLILLPCKENFLSFGNL